jgi:hypothetical protein
MKQEHEIFEQAMALSSPEAREEYLLAACGQNRDLRRSVDELLVAFNDAVALAFLLGGDRAQEEAVRRRVALEILKPGMDAPSRVDQISVRPESTKPESKP